MTRRLDLTEAGWRVVGHASAILDQAEAADAALALMKGDPSGRLNLVAPIILGRAFVARYPRINVALDWSIRQVNPIEVGIDVVVRVGRPPDSLAMPTRLGNTEVRLYAPHATAAEQPRQRHDLAQCRLVALGHSLSDASLVMRREGRAETVAVPHTLVSNDVLPVVAAARATRAFALLPRFAALDGWEKSPPNWNFPLGTQRLVRPFAGGIA